MAGLNTQCAEYNTMMQQHNIPPLNRRPAAVHLSFFAILLFFVFSNKGLSMETQFTLNTEDTLAHNWETVIRSFWETRVTEEFITAKDNIKLYTIRAVHPSPKGTIVFSSGRTESAVKYKELIYDLYQNGYTVLAMDHRGQGRSGRMLSDPEKGYVDDFDHYVEDLHQFYAQIVQPHSAEKPFLLCHSMGSAIGALYSIKYPGQFQKIVFGSPMFGINSPLPDAVAKGILWVSGVLNNLFGDESWYFLGQGKMQLEPFEGNALTQSEQRYQIFLDVAKEYPDTRLGGVTIGWLIAALAGMDNILEQAGKISAPVLLLQAANDQIVANHAQQQACDAMPNCTMKVIPNARHELYMEADIHRIPALTAALAFFATKP